MFSKLNSKSKRSCSFLKLKSSKLVNVEIHSTLHGDFQKSILIVNQLF